MKRKRDYYVAIWAIAGITLFSISGCTKSIINVNVDRPDKEDDGSGSSQTALVTFSASVESLNLTRSMSPMQKGFKSDLFAYQYSGNLNTEVLTAQGSYATTAPGILNGLNGYKMYLANGTYNFYAVSDNIFGAPPSFANGKSEPLLNGIDYLWWGSPNHDVVSSQVNIPIIYQHVATQVVIDVFAGDSLKLDGLVLVTITPPYPDARMNLFTGEIPATTQYDNPEKMGINGLRAQYIMLPLKTNEPMKLMLEVKVNGEINPRTYNAEISLPDGELKAGQSYLFNAIIDENVVSFPSVSIKDWTEVDETGKPILPIQK